MIRVCARVIIIIKIFSNFTQLHSETLAHEKRLTTEASRAIWTEGIYDFTIQRKVGFICLFQFLCIIIYVYQSRYDLLMIYSI